MWQMIKQRIIKKGISFILAAGLLCSDHMPGALEGLQMVQEGYLTKAEAKAQENVQWGEAGYEYLETTEKVQSFYRTKISWKKKNVDKYIIYKVMDDGVKRKKLAVLSGDKTSYMIKTKKNQYYSLEIRGWKYKKGTKETVFEYFGQPMFYSGIMPVGFGDYTWAESYISTKKIQLDFYVDTGITPDGILFYRKEQGEKKFQIVGKRKWSKIKSSWVDKTVKARKKYIYKMRTYKYIRGKKYYGPFSEEMEKNTVNMFGTYTVSGDPEGNAPVLKVKGDKNNGTLVFYPSEFLDCTYFSKKDENVCYRVSGVSLDGKKWITKQNAGQFQKKSSLGGKDCFWLRFKKEEQVKRDEDSYMYDWENEYEFGQDVRYNGVPSFVIISPHEKRGYTMENAEAVH